MILLIEQLLNGAQFGVMLFLMAAGLTLVFGIMNLINLAHGSLYMIGAYVAATAFGATHSFLLALLRRVAGALVVGIAIELVVFRALYQRDHLDQVLATFGLILFFNEMVRIIWGATALYTAGAALPLRPGDAAAGRALSGLPPGHHRGRAAGGAAALAAGVRTRRLGMLIRAGVLEPHDGGRARGQHHAALHAGVRAGRDWRRCPARWRDRSSRSSPAWATAS